jgi:hypothetical protein
MLQVQESNLFVENLWKNINTDVKLASLSKFRELVAKGLVSGLVQQDLRKDLVGERAGHDEGRVSSSTAQVDKTSISQENDMSAIWQKESVNLRLNIGNALGVLLQPCNINLDIKMADIW